MDKIKTLTPETAAIVLHKHTERPHSSAYCAVRRHGAYLCRRCGLALFRPGDQFESRCGWPSFDDAVGDRVAETPDADGRRTEILCRRCGAHLGHVFRGEGMTAKNLRHCVNGLALEYVDAVDVRDSEEAVYAGGCFWGIQHCFDDVPGVLKTEVGYTGGTPHWPDYERVCRGDSGHFEATRVLYDPAQTDYTVLTRLFFEVHDPTQRDGQGPDIGQQYQSAVFYLDEAQRAVAASLIAELKKNFKVVTRLLPATVFWPAEDYHQHYYRQKQQHPACHRRVQRFNK